MFLLLKHLINKNMLSIEASKKARKQIEKNLLETGSATIYPQGTSMYPLLIEKRDFVTVSSLSDHKIKKGDIILFCRTDGLLVLHRLCRIKKEGYYFVGDNQTIIEGPILRNQLIAYVELIYRKQKKISVHNFFYRFLSSVWLFLRPLRPHIAKTAAKIYHFTK